MYDEIFEELISKKGGLMLKLNMPYIPQTEFADAFKVLDELIVRDLPRYGFRYPFMGPGGYYGGCWWERDSSLTLLGYRWLDQGFCEKALENFTFVQKENGRIPLWGNDRVQDYDEQLSAIPVIFETALKICRRTNDRDYINKIYRMLCAYMDWWLSPVKRDAETGLICGIFEETDPCDNLIQHAAAQVDLNVQICVGADCLAEIAGYLGLNGEAEKWKAVFSEQKAAVNEWLYEPADGAYYTWLVKEKRRMIERPYNSMLDVFKRGILPKEREFRLVNLMHDDTLFGWGREYALTTMARTGHEYQETVGTYKGHISWMGNIWSMRNKIIASGLHEYGRLDDSAYLAWKTVREFSGKYAEFISPTDGRGHGVERYGWTASEYIELIIEEIIGLSYSAWTGEIKVEPNLPEDLKDTAITLDNASLGDGRFVSVRIENGKADFRVSDKETEE